FNPVLFANRAGLPRRSFMRRLGAHARSLVANRPDFILLLGLRENCDYNTSRSMNHNTTTTCKRLSSAESLTLAHKARVVEWQTRTFEGRMPKGMRVQVPPRALLYCQGAPASREMMAS